MVLSVLFAVRLTIRTFMVISWSVTLDRRFFIHQSPIHQYLGYKWLLTLDLFFALGCFFHFQNRRSRELVTTRLTVKLKWHDNTSFCLFRWSENRFKLEYDEEWCGQGFNGSRWETSSNTTEYMIDSLAPTSCVGWVWVRARKQSFYET